MFIVIPSSEKKWKRLSSKTVFPEEKSFICPVQCYNKNHNLYIYIYISLSSFPALSSLSSFIFIQATFAFNISVNCKLIKATNQSKHIYSVLLCGN